MKICEHDSILRLIDVFETPSHMFVQIVPALDSLPDLGSSYLITEYCPHGELYHYILTRKISPDTARRFFSQLISAVRPAFLFPRSSQTLTFDFAGLSSPPTQHLPSRYQV